MTPREKELLQTVDELRRENALLRQKIDLFVKRVFGSSSEQLNPAQLELLMGVPESSAVVVTTVPPEKKPSPSPVKKRVLRFCTRGLLKDRVAIPLHDAGGALVGYAGRVVDDNAISEDNPRYRFPGARKRGDTLHEFRKTLFIYNGFRIIGLVDDLIVVEGFTSVWWLHQNGLASVVATMGADCSENQAELIVSLVKPNGRVWIAPDGDKAGERHAQTLLALISPHRFVRWLKLTDGKQPTDMSSEQLKSSFTP